MIKLANSLTQWTEPITLMWRFSKNNAVTEGFHRKMKLIQRRAYGFKNFDNYRLRVIAQCG
nr:transposase [Coraliomargarita sinensis]